ncbi:MAG: hypothetical protein NVSMB48_10950 [Marmoricola sp.]
METRPRADSSAAFVQAPHDRLVATGPALDEALGNSLATGPNGAGGSRNPVRCRDSYVVLAERANDTTDHRIDRGCPHPGAPARGVWQPTPRTGCGQSDSPRRPTSTYSEPFAAISSGCVHQDVSRGASQHPEYPTVQALRGGGQQAVLDTVVASALGKQVTHRRLANRHLSPSAAKTRAPSPPGPWEFGWYPQRDSNPCYRRERATS